ncbi:MAG: type II toxin-antitoxin system VapC family toxin [Xanthomonadaceae bacterium]|nr:type II toxin-antitoxin system VapC family toxin [Xanthomonadaceae bacterium]
MRLLLDTHALLWWWTDDKQLSGIARKAIAEEDNTVLVSAASVWEISTKFRLGKLAIAQAALKQFQALIEADGFEHLPITWQHSLLAGGYPHEHRDPFDRMLAAQSEIEKATLVTCDAAFGVFNTAVLW